MGDWVKLFFDKNIGFDTVFGIICSYIGIEKIVNMFVKYLRFHDFTIHNQITLRNGLYHSINDNPVISNNHLKMWYYSGRIHRDNDKPAIVSNSLTDKIANQIGYTFFDMDLIDIVYNSGYPDFMVNIWCKDGKIHRDNDKPAVVFRNGMMEWWENGKRHRQNGMYSIIMNINYLKTDVEEVSTSLLYDFDCKLFQNNQSVQIWYRFGKLYREGNKPPIIYSG